MDLATLCNLLDGFIETRQHLEAAALSAADPALRAELELQVRNLSAIIADLRGEVLARQRPGSRSAATTREFEARLRRVLKRDAHMQIARVPQTV